MSTPEPECFVFGWGCYADPADNPPELGYMVWRYCDTGELVDNSPRRVCPRCHLFPTRSGHDPCLGTLTGVTAACCGHGVHDGYVRFARGALIRGRFEHLL